MPSIRLQEITKEYLGLPFTKCIRRTVLVKFTLPTHIIQMRRCNLTRTSSDGTFEAFSAPEHNNYDPIKCQYKRLHYKIYTECDCILRYIEDIDEFFDMNIQNLRKCL